uniref:Uncharacterized protein n=1 Tax=viral metagenome TaxID=1070528 RepID=A0A2V0RAD7_9ZZZZ
MLNNHNSSPFISRPQSHRRNFVSLRYSPHLDRRIRCTRVVTCQAFGIQTVGRVLRHVRPAFAFDLRTFINRIRDVDDSNVINNVSLEALSNAGYVVSTPKSFWITMVFTSVGSGVVFLLARKVFFNKPDPIYNLVKSVVDNSPSTCAGDLSDRLVQTGISYPERKLITWTVSNTHFLLFCQQILCILAILLLFTHSLDLLNTS